MLKDYKILRVVIPIYIPYIFLYALYIQINGEVSPGGGFQAGVIFVSGIIGYDLIYGIKSLKEHFTKRILLLGGVFGVLIYSGVGVICMIMGGNYLDYSSLAEAPKTGQHIGIFVIEIGVGLTVTSIMALIYTIIRGIEEG